MKTIGVLGGLGPQATMEFEACVHSVAQRLIPPSNNSGYPPMLVYYLREPPVQLTAAGTPVTPLQPNPRLFDAANALGHGADFLVIPSNTPHTFREQIEAAARRPVLSMIDVVVAEVVRRRPRLAGVLEANEGTMYHGALAQQGIASRYLPAEARVSLNAAIFALMEGRAQPETRAVAQEAVDRLRATGADVIIMGCTEIPLLLGDESEAADLINPAHLLAEAAVRQAMG